MMRLWVQSYAKQAPVGSSATLSLVVHSIIIAAWVFSTLPAPDVPTDSIANRVIFIPPPDRVPGRAHTETVRYVEVNRPGDGQATGDGPRMMGEARPTVPDESIGRAPKDTVVVPTTTETPVPPAGLQDSVFSVLDVDTAVVRSSSSAAPAYPIKLLEARIMGSVSAQYIVDTTGFADTASFTVMKATHPEFILAVKEALPYMRFRPAKIGALKVRQLVEQQFSFRITADTGTVAPRRPQ